MSAVVVALFADDLLRLSWHVYYSIMQEWIASVDAGHQQVLMQA